MMQKRVVILLILLAVLLVGIPAAAQEDGDPAAQIERLAAQVNQHDLWSGDVTVWAGGQIGADIGLSPVWRIGDALTGWNLPGLRADDPALAWDDLERPTVLNIWASWCGPCVDEFPLLAQIATAPDDHPYDVVFINGLDDESGALAFLDNQRPGLHVLRDPDGNLLNQVAGTLVVPVSILLEPDGAVIAVHIGNFTSVHAAFFNLLLEKPDFEPFDVADVPGPVLFTDLPDDLTGAMPIAYGDVVDGVITEDAYQQVYQFEAQAGDVIAVQMDVDDSDLLPGDAVLEPYLVVLALDGSVVGTSETVAYNPQAVFKSAPLSADGVYTIVAARYMGALGLTTGAYRLSLSDQ